MFLAVHPFFRVLTVSRTYFWYVACCLRMPRAARISGSIAAGSAPSVGRADPTVARDRRSGEMEESFILGGGAAVHAGSWRDGGKGE